jgi:hypothetical protein
MEPDRQLGRRVRLGDVGDLEAPVGDNVRKTFPWLSPEEHEEMKRDGFELAVRIFRRLPHGHSLAAALAHELPDDLRDRAKASPEYLRNPKAGTARTVERESLSERGAAAKVEEGVARLHENPAERERRETESRLALRAFQSERDFRNPRLVGRCSASRPTGRCQALRPAM